MLNWIGLKKLFGCLLNGLTVDVCVVLCVCMCTTHILPVCNCTSVILNGLSQHIYKYIYKMEKKGSLDIGIYFIYVHISWESCTKMYELPWLFDCVCQYQPNYLCQTYKITTLYKHVNGFEMHHTHISYFSLRRRVAFTFVLLPVGLVFFLLLFNSYSLHIFSIRSSLVACFYRFESHTFDPVVHFHSFTRFSIYERISSTFQWITTVYSSSRHRIVVVAVVVIVISSTYHTNSTIYSNHHKYSNQIDALFSFKPSNK